MSSLLLALILAQPESISLTNRTRAGDTWKQSMVMEIANGAETAIIKGTTTWKVLAVANDGTRTLERMLGAIEISSGKDHLSIEDLYQSSWTIAPDGTLMSLKGAKLSTSEQAIAQAMTPSLPSNSVQLGAIWSRQRDFGGKLIQVKYQACGRKEITGQLATCVKLEGSEGKYSVSGEAWISEADGRLMQGDFALNGFSADEMGSHPNVKLSIRPS